MEKFNSKTIKELKYYVYALTYKEEKEDITFYMGKVKSNRVYAHFDDVDKLKQMEDNEAITEKLEVIMNRQTNAFIINAGLTKEEALFLEASLISTMRRFKKHSLTNIVNGHHYFTPEKVDAINFKYSSPINLEAFCEKHKVKILALKSNEESYYSSVDKDFRAVLEGIWTLSSDRMERVDYVVGVLKGNIYAVYKYVKGSYKKVDDTWTQDELDHWNTSHIAIGRPAHYYVNGADSDLQKFKKEGKGVLKLSPISVPDSQNTVIGIGITDQDKKIGSKLINRNIEDEKFTKVRLTGRFYFGFEDGWWKKLKK